MMIAERHRLSIGLRVDIARAHEITLFWCSAADRARVARACSPVHMPESVDCR